MKKVEIAPEAIADIQQAISWYELREPGLVSFFLDEVTACVSRIAENPTAYQAVQRDARRSVVNRFPYVILYVVRNDVVKVVACFHGHRDQAAWMTRIV